MKQRRTFPVSVQAIVQASYAAAVIALAGAGPSGVFAQTPPGGARSDEDRATTAPPASSKNVPNGPDTKASAMGSKPDPQTTTVHESKPKPSQAGGSGKRSKSDREASGAGGFDRGLYGTGTGSVK
jgi:hypothetical protein